MTGRGPLGRRLDLRGALARTLRTLPRVWGTAWGALVLAAALAAAPLMIPMSAISCLVWGAATALASLIAVGALVRVGVSDDGAAAKALGLGPAGFQLGWPEARLVGALVLCLIFLVMVMTVLALVLLAVFGVADLDLAAIQARDWAAVGPVWKLMVLGVAAAGAAAIPLLLTVRLSLFAPATLGRGHMVSLNSMGIAYGSFWPLLAGLVVTAAPGLVLIAFEQGLALAQPWASVVRSGLLWGLQAPLTIAFLGSAYRQLEYWTPGEGAS